MNIRVCALALACGLSVASLAQAGVIDKAQKADAQQSWSAWGGDIGVRWNRGLLKNIGVTVEFMKDGEAGETITSKLESAEVGTDEDGDTITSCVVVATDQPTATAAKGPRLTANQSTMLAILQRAGRPLTAEEWTDQAREAGLNISRVATYWDLRMALLGKGLVYEGVNGWLPK